uniref:Uncharacterized protein n=1 Tax=Arcella intermedia TaxID=1963864 RepID=A0A6B2LKL9_9EUKA
MLDILDTAGQDEYSAMRDQYMRTGQAFLFVYSVDSRNSFDALEEFREALLRAKDTEKVPLVLCANKADLSNHKVQKTEGAALSRRWDVPFFETSAFTRQNVEEAFFQLVREIRIHNGFNLKKKAPKTKQRNCQLL